MTEKIPKAEYLGEIELGEYKIPCAVLDDETRILRERSVARALGKKGSGAYWQKKKQTQKGAILPEYISTKNLDLFIDNELRNKLINPITYQTKSGTFAQGINATLLPEICNVWLKAREKGATYKNQENTAHKAEILMRGLAHIGIIALVDEATGYQDVRMKKVLNKILNKFLLNEAKKYKVTFPLELYKEWFKLNGWEWKEENAQKRPGVLGRWTSKYIYARMAPRLLETLEEKNPKTEKGYRKHKHFQFLTDDVGEPRLREFFGGHLALARATTTWRKYISLVEKSYPAIGDQLKIFREEDFEE
jgi:hypothetical protein